jgi:hypothetical protein
VRLRTRERECAHKCRAGFCVHPGDVVATCHGRLFAFCVRLQQYLSEVLILMFRSLQIGFVERWIVLFEVLQPTVQPPDNVVQPSKKIFPVVPHPDPPKISLD